MPTPASTATADSPTVSDDELQSRQADLALAVRLAREAGQVAVSHYGKVERLTKTHARTTDEPVTIADRAAQEVIVAGLRSSHPDDGIIGEESEEGDGITATQLSRRGRNWVIDPIDGTNNFIAGLGNWAVCIGLLEQGMPTVGVVYDVTRQRVYAGAVGIGAMANEDAMHADEEPLSPASILMLTSNLLDAEGRCPRWAMRWISQTDWKVRMLGSAALEAVLVGAGIASGAVTVNGKLWDCVAPSAVTLAAGGRVTRLDGQDLFPFNVDGYDGAKVPFLSSANAEVADELVREMREHAAPRKL